MTAQAQAQAPVSGAAFIQNLVAQNPSISVEVLQTMVEVYRLETQAREAEREAEREEQFHTDLANLMGEIPVIAKSAEAKVQTRGAGGQGGGSFSIKYLPLSDVVAVINPLLEKYGFFVTFGEPQNEGTFQDNQEARGNTQGTFAGNLSATCILIHKTGKKMTSKVSLPIDNSGAKNALQALGSTMTYLRRYALFMMFNIATGDDDDGVSISAETVVKATSKKKLSPANEDKAIEQIIAGRYELSQIYDGYDLTDEQKAKLNRAVKQAGAALGSHPKDQEAAQAAPVATRQPPKAP